MEGHTGGHVPCHCQQYNVIVKPLQLYYASDYWPPAKQRTVARQSAKENATLNATDTRKVACAHEILWRMNANAEHSMWRIYLPRYPGRTYCTHPDGNGQPVAEVGKKLQIQQYWTYIAYNRDRERNVAVTVDHRNAYIIRSLSAAGTAPWIPKFPGVPNAAWTMQAITMLLVLNQPLSPTPTRTTWRMAGYYSSDTRTRKMFYALRPFVKETFVGMICWRIMFIFYENCTCHIYINQMKQHSFRRPTRKLRVCERGEHVIEMFWRSTWLSTLRIRWESYANTKCRMRTSCIYRSYFISGHARITFYRYFAQSSFPPNRWTLSSALAACSDARFGLDEYIKTNAYRHRNCLVTYVICNLFNRLLRLFYTENIRWPVGSCWCWTCWHHSFTFVFGLNQ